MKKQIQYLLVGYPFAGKTFIAKELEKRLKFTRLSIDEIKFEMGYEGVSDDDISASEWEKIFNELDKRIIVHLKAGKTIINEYAWLTQEWRNRARRLASEQRIESKVIFVDTPESVVRARWEKNRNTKERFDVPDTVFEEAIKIFERPTEEENVIVFAHNENLEKWIKRNFNNNAFL